MTNEIRSLNYFDKEGTINVIFQSIHLNDTRKQYNTTTTKRNSTDDENSNADADVMCLKFLNQLNSS